MEDRDERSLMAAKLKVDKGIVSSSSAKVEAEAAKEELRDADRTIRRVRGGKTRLAAPMNLVVFSLWKSEQDVRPKKGKMASPKLPETI